MDKKTLESKSISELKVIASSIGLSDIESLKKKVQIFLAKKLNLQVKKKIKRNRLEKELEKE